MTGQANEAETKGQQAAAEAFSGLNSTSSQDAILAALQNPWSNEGQQLTARTLLSQQQEAADPLRQLQIQQAQLELNQAQNPTPQPGYRPMSAEERAAWGIPADDTTPYAIGPDNKPTAIGDGGGQTINVNNGGSNDFYKPLDQKSGEQTAALMDAGRNAQSNNMRLGQLQQLLTTAPQGAAGGMLQAAASVGLNVEGADDLQAAQALINQMVPLQRPPGSGTMSDADLALFKASLPNVLNQPGGNAKIINTMMAINDYTIKQAQIAERVANREITPADGRAMQAAIPNPLATQQAGATDPTAPLGSAGNPIPAADLFKDMLQ